jgi:hypothetical protein
MPRFIGISRYSGREGDFTQGVNIMTHLTVINRTISVFLLMSSVVDTATDRCQNTLSIVGCDIGLLVQLIQCR